MDDESEGQKVEPHSSTASRNLLDVQKSSDRHPLHDTPTQSQSESFITTKGSRYKMFNVFCRWQIKKPLIDIICLKVARDVTHF